MNERVTIIGTSHISQESIQNVTEYITINKPDIVAVELDKHRFYALLHDKKNKFSLKDIKHVGIFGFLFAYVGQYVQKKLGQQVNVKPGSDMMAAIKTAKENNCIVALIDQDVNITLKRLKITPKEGGRMFIDFVKGLLFPKRTIKEYGLEEFDLRKVPPLELINQLIEQIKVRYPSIYKALIHERNVYMAKKINLLLTHYPDKKILVVVGAGHNDMNNLIQ